MRDEPKVARARAFLRSFQILLKAARMYGLQHQRTTAQLEASWKELRSALPADDQSGLVVGVAGSQLLLDGTALDANPAERAFVELLSDGGLASIYFSSQVTTTDFARFVQVFAAGAGKGTDLANQLRAALGEGQDGGIRINEIRYVPEEAARITGEVAGTVIAESLGTDALELQRWLSDPMKLLELLAAAEGSRSSPTTGGEGEEGSGGGSAGGPQVASGSAGSGPAAPVAETEEDILAALRVLTKLAQVDVKTPSAAQAVQTRKEVAQLPAGTQVTLRQALASLAAIPASARPDTPMVLQLAEHLAIRFAMERYERGHARVNSVRELLHRMGREIDGLRKILSAHEEKLRGAGLPNESHVEILERHFWTAVPEESKRAILLSAEAWSAPPRGVRAVVEQLLEAGDARSATQILRNFAACLSSPYPEARPKCAAALPELADLYAKRDLGLLAPTLKMVGEQLSQEPPGELQNLLGEAFISLGQHAGTQREPNALRQFIASGEELRSRAPTLAVTLRARLGAEKWLPDLIEEAVRAPHVAEGLLDAVRLVPEAALEHLATRFARCCRRRERERLVGLASELGPKGVERLVETLRSRPASESVFTVGLLARLNIKAMEAILPGRLREWDFSSHDLVVRQVAGSGAPERGRLLAHLLPWLHRLVRPAAVDEIGMSGDLTTVPLLIRVAAEELVGLSSPYLRVKAIEALGRLRAVDAAPLLRRLVEAQQNWHWVQPSELRIVAAQALTKIDPAWVQTGLSGSDLDPADLALGPLDPPAEAPGVRHRCYARVRFPRSVRALLTTPQGQYSLEISQMSLGGGLAEDIENLPIGAEATLVLQAGWRNPRAQVLPRDMGSGRVAFEIVNIDLEERLKLRALLVKIKSRAA